MNNNERRLTLVALSPSCKRLVLYYGDTTQDSVILDHVNYDACFDALNDLRASLPRFTVRDVATGYEWPSTKGV